MNSDSETWSRDWVQRIRTRLHSLGYGSVGKYLQAHPGEPYEAAAKRLGDDVAAVQLSQMQVEEVFNESEFRYVAMDALARELNANLPKGWQCCSDLPQIADGQTTWRHLAAKSAILASLTDDANKDRVEFQTSGAYAFWVIQLQSHDPTVETRADAVWKRLKGLPPPVGWRPSGANDPVIARAFEEGWPSPPAR